MAKVKNGIHDLIFCWFDFTLKYWKYCYIPTKMHMKFKLNTMKLIYIIDFVMYIGTSNPPAFLETCWIYSFSWGWQQRQIPVVTRARSVESTAGTKNFWFSSGHRSRSSVTQGPVDPRPPDHAVSPPCPRWGEWLHFTSVNRCSQISPPRKWSRVIRFLQHLHQDGSGGSSFWTSIVQCRFQNQRHRKTVLFAILSSSVVSFALSQQCRECGVDLYMFLIYSSVGTWIFRIDDNPSNFSELNYQ